MSVLVLAMGTVPGLHLNFIPGSYSPPREPAMTTAERSFLHHRAEWAEQAGAYSHVQRTRPLTLAYGLSDSPVGLAAWIAEKFSEWADPASSLSTDTILTNIMIYWLTNSIASEDFWLSIQLPYSCPGQLFKLLEQSRALSIST